jgi:hypothetical protein
MVPVLKPVLEVPTEPVHGPVPPVAAHDVAFAVDQVKVVDWPATIELGDAVKVETVAAGGGALVMFKMTELLGPVPAVPVHVNV